MSKAVVKSRIADNGLEDNSTKRARREDPVDFSYTCFKGVGGVSMDILARSLRSVKRRQNEPYI